MTNYDKVVEAKLLDMIPSYQHFLNGIESSDVVTNQLQQIRNQQGSHLFNTNALFNTNYSAPNFVGITKWLNTDKSLSLKDLKGKVVLVDFWTYTCINCIRTLPHVTAWYDKYKDKGFVVIGVHTPEFAFEKDTGNVENAIKQFGIHYPVGQDNNYTTWTNYSNEYWPAEYLIDAQGNVRRTHFGEGEYDQSEKAIQQLLKEAGQKVATNIENMPDQTPHEEISPETYFGASRMAYFFSNGTLPTGIQTFTLPTSVPLNTFAFGGGWNILNEYAQAGASAVVKYQFTANNVYMVVGPGNQKNGSVHVLLDSKEITSENAGEDIKGSTVSVDSQRLYHLVNLHGKAGEHTLQLEFGPGIQLFTFTFG